MSTTWLLDVDGVLNASKAGWHRAPHKGSAYYNGRLWKMRFEPQVMEAIRNLQLSGLVEIKWATTWVGETEQLEHLFRLPALLSAASESMSGSAKVLAAQAVLDAGDRLIWTDDEFTPDEGAYFDEYTKSGQALFIKPKSSRGLRPEHLQAIQEFVLGENIRSGTRPLVSRANKVNSR